MSDPTVPSSLPSYGMDRGGGSQNRVHRPGSPWENGYCESFNSKLRDERRDLLLAPRRASSSRDDGSTTRSDRTRLPTRLRPCSGRLRRPRPRPSCAQTDHALRILPEMGAGHQRAPALSISLRIIDGNLNARAKLGRTALQSGTQVSRTFWATTSGSSTGVADLNFSIEVRIPPLSFSPFTNAAERNSSASPGGVRWKRPALWLAPPAPGFPSIETPGTGDRRGQRVAPM